MASSSFAASSSTGRYDVFLNFRGKDTRNNFTSFLNLVFRNRGINVFMDSENLWTGEAIGPSLCRAIEGSKICIPIFSKNYADSKWCLMELAQIVQCHRSKGQLILPIFFNVHPSDVRHQTGSFEEAFREHQQKFEPQLMESWREALRVVGELKGEVIDETVNQANLVESLAKRVLSELVHGTHLAECKCSIGMESRVSDVLHLLNVGSENDDVQFVGICGFGGIGKTTIAKAVYNNFFLTFNRHSFLSDIREQASQFMGLVSLQKRLLKDMFKVDIDIVDCHTGKEYIQQKLCHEKVLVVLDDVDKQEQVDALAGELSWFGKGSKVIITTRDEHILNVAKVCKDKIYKPQKLDTEQSLQLFSLHAFSEDQPPEDYIQLSHDLACYSGGLPLILKVIGSFLSDVSSKEVWECTLQKLKGIPHEDVQRRLRISYDNLEDYYQKPIFLDAACFFIGWEKKTLISFWEACGYHPKSAIDRLIKRSLLSFEEDYDDGEYYLNMHDHIRDMGRKIVLEESHGELGKLSRLWSHNEVVEILEGYKGTDMVQGMVIPRGVRVTNEHFKMMSHLRFLELSLDYFNGDFSCLPSSIRLFKGSISNSLPTNFYHKRLVLLDLSYPNGMINQAWNIEPHSENKFQSLKVLNLSGWNDLSACPDFSCFPHLERLDLQECTSLDKLDDSIGDLKYLVNLNLYCTKISELPNSISKLSSLQQFILKDCKSLKKLPKSIGDLKSLVKLDLCGTQIEELPNSISRLSSLQELTLTACLSLDRLPESVGDLNALVRLDLCGTQVEALPNSFSRLNSLEELILAECCSLKRLPHSIGDLKALVKIDLCWTRIKKLPNSIYGLSSLKELILSECSSLKGLPESIGDLKSLVKLDLSGLEIEELPNSISRLSSLQELILTECYSLKKLPNSIGDLKALEKINLCGTRIEEFPSSISSLSSLKELILMKCSLLKRLPESIGDLKCLVKLDLRGSQIEELPNSISRMTNLKELMLKSLQLGAEIEDLPISISRLDSLEALEFCKKSLKKLPESIGDLKSIVKLDLSGTQIEELPNSISRMTSLKELILMECSSLKKLPKSIGNLKSLVKLNLCGAQIEELPSSISRLGSLKIFEFCKSLKKLPESIGDLKSIVKLDLSGTQIEELPNSISKMTSLKELILLECSSLKKLPGSIRDLKSLFGFYLSSTKLEKLPELPSCLVELRCRNCYSLIGLPDLSRLETLSILDLEGCIKLQEIGGLNKTESLRVLNAKGCYNLTCAPPGNKIHGQGKILWCSSLKSHTYFLTAEDGIYTKQLVLCLVLEFSSGLVYNAKLKEGCPVSIDLDVESYINSTQISKTTKCHHTLRIEDVEYASERDMIYIHQFKGFDWFGFPLQGKDDIFISSISQSVEFYDPEGVRCLVKCQVKLRKLFFKNEKPDHSESNRHSSVTMVADFFLWSHSNDDDDKDDNHIDDDGGGGVPSLRLGSTFWSQDGAEGSSSTPMEKQEKRTLVMDNKYKETFLDNDNNEASWPFPLSLALTVPCLELTLDDGSNQQKLDQSSYLQENGKNSPSEATEADLLSCLRSESVSDVIEQGRPCKRARLQDNND